MCRTSGRTLIAQRSNTAATARRRPRGNDIMRATVRERGPRGGHPWARGRPRGSHRLRGARTAAARREASNHPRHGRRRADAGKASARGSESLLADGRSREADNVSNRKQFDIRPCLERRRCPAALPHNPYKCYRHFQVTPRRGVDVTTGFHGEGEQTYEVETRDFRIVMEPMTASGLCVKQVALA
jgi:hypothetical protein